MLFLQPEPSLKIEKAAARRWARQARAAFTPEQWAAFGAAMARQLCLLPAWQAARTVFCFASHGPEPDTLPLLQAALAEGKQLCLPRCTGPGQMEAIPLGDLALLAPGAYGIPEPPAHLPPCPPEGIQMAVLPCLAAGPDGTRLGHGGGYYDRWLARCPGAYRAVLCPEALLAPHLPADALDLPAQCIVTERRVLTL